MCLNPLKVSNYHSKYFSSDYSLRPVLTVPCGNCYQCNMKKSQDLYLRSQDEFRSCISSGGSAIFLTFTYDESHVPYKYFYLGDDGLIYLDSVSRDSGADNVLMCFDTSHFQNYLASIRRDLARTYNVPSSAFRYVCTSEYGSKSTQRPHYHCIFFLSSALLSAFGFTQIECQNFNDKVCSFLLDYFSKYWSHGFVSASDAGLFLTNDSCCSYVSKYVSKNSELLSYSRFQNFFDFILDCFDKGLLSCPYGHDFKSPLSFFLYYCRLFNCNFRSYTSKFFGLGLLRRVDVSSPSSVISSLDTGIRTRVGNKSKVCPFPAYIVRKLFYSNRSDGSYYLNDLGINCFSDRTLQSIKTCSDNAKTFNYSLLDKTPLNVFPKSLSCVDLSACCGLLSSYSEPIFAYNFLIRGRLFNKSVLSDVSSLWSDYFTGKLSLSDFVDLMSRYVSTSYVNSNVISSWSDSLGFKSRFDSCSFSHLKLKDYFFFTTNSCLVSDSSLLDVDEFFVSEFCYFDILLDFWYSLTTFHRSCLLNFYRSQYLSSKLVRDTFNFNFKRKFKYGHVSKVS